MKYKTQIRKRLMYIFHINGWRENPKPSWYYPADGWITDEQEIKRAIMLDEEMGFKKDE